MDVTQLAFNRFIGLEAADVGGEYLVRLPEGDQYLNHLGTVHASALLAVAEAGSGAFLLHHVALGDEFVPVVRRLEAKFRKPAHGRVAARCSLAADTVGQWSAELAARGRVLIRVPIEVVDAQGVVVMSATVEWFVARA